MVTSAGDQGKPLRGYCPDCAGEKWADIVGSHCNDWRDDESGIAGTIDYRILKCRGCDSVYFQRDEVFSEDEDHRQDPNTGDWETFSPHRITYWPVPTKRERPGWFWELGFIDSDIAGLLGDIYVALNNDLRVLSAMGVRTVFDRASELLGVDPTIPFTKKIDALFQGGKIGAEECETLSILTDAGSAAAHRGWRPSVQEMDVMMSLIEAFLYRTFILGDAAKVLKAKVPAKPQRVKELKADPALRAQSNGPVENSSKN